RLRCAGGGAGVPGLGTGAPAARRTPWSASAGWGGTGSFDMSSPPESREKTDLPTTVRIAAAHVIWTACGGEQEAEGAQRALAFPRLFDYGGCLAKTDQGADDASRHARGDRERPRQRRCRRPAGFGG